MKWFLGTYTGRFNRRHKLFGHLFSGRYKALIVDGSGDGYLRTVCDYVHLNPVRARLLKREQRLEAFGWSSYPGYLRPAGGRPAWLRVGRLLGEHGIPRDSAAGRREFARRMEARRDGEEDEDFKAIRRGWFLGGQELKGELLAQMGERVGAEHYGSERQESQKQRAEAVVREELRKRRWQEGTLIERRKGDAEKVSIAVRLRNETLVPAAWIARRLQMGSVGYLNNRLYLWRREKLKSIQR